MARLRWEECHAPVVFTVRATWKMRLAAEAEIWLLRVANRPAAVAVLKLEKRFGFVGLLDRLLRHHDRPHTRGPAVVSHGWRWELGRFPRSPFSGRLPCSAISMAARCRKAVRTTAFVAGRAPTALPRQSSRLADVTSCGLQSCEISL